MRVVRRTHAVFGGGVTTQMGSTEDVQEQFDNLADQEEEYNKRKQEKQQQFEDDNYTTVGDNKIFTVVEVECLGACCNAPMVQINDDYYEDLDEESFKKILQDLKINKSIKVGSQIGRKSSQPERKFDA